MNIKVSDYIAEFIRTQQIDCVFEVAGGMITHLLDSVYQLGNTNIISVHHEQAAAFAVDAYGRVTGKPGFAFATSGPGATNLLTGIASCYFDSSPGIFITGQVNVSEQKNGRGVRQLGFQETDIVTMAAPITKKCFRVTHADQIESVMNEAFECAISDRPGPVLIDLPMNIQREKISPGEIPLITRKFVPSESLLSAITELSEAIRNASKPLVLVGRGVQSAFARQALLQWIEQSHLPVVTSLLGLEIMPYHHPLRVGFIGTYGNRWANMALGMADLLIVIGSRLDIRQTGADVAGFCQGKKIYHIDCDKHEMNNRVKGCIPIVADASEFLKLANAEFQRMTFPKHDTWLELIQSYRTEYPDIAELKDFQGINPNVFMHHLSNVSQSAKAYVADVGNHQMWAAQSLELNDEQLYLTSGGMGAMGFALPAAIGASYALHKQPVVAIVGDGAFQMNIQELQTVIRNKLPIRIIVMNNNCLGMIRQFQDSYFDSRYQSTYWGYSAPDFASIAKAYGLPAMTISENHEMDEAMNWLKENENGPHLLQVMISHLMNVYPKIAFGKPITEMEPFAKPIEMEST